MSEPANEPIAGAPPERKTGRGLSLRRRTLPAALPSAPGDDGTDTVDDPLALHRLQRRMWRPIIAGSVVFGVFFVGSIAWAAIFEIAGAVLATSFVKVEENRKVVKHRDGGIVRAIFVREGSPVSQGDLLMRMDDVGPRAQVEVYRGQLDSFLGQKARFLAERDDRQAVTFPPELTARTAEPAIRTILEDQANLFRSRLDTLTAQIDVQNQKIQQLDNRIAGLGAQIKSVDRQHELIEEELVGVQSLYEKGLATKAKYLQLKRTSADLEGQRGSLLADVTRAKESIGESRVTITQLRSQRVSEAADGLRDVQNRMADTVPKLRTAEEVLQQIEVRAPIGGYVHNLTQFTDGGVVGAGEQLLDIVPNQKPLVIEARIKPEDISKVGAGMPARVRLTAYKARVVPIITAQVIKVSADRLQDPKTGEAYFAADLKVDPDELARLAPQVHLSPGMPAQSMIVTGDRTVLDYVLSPITNVLSGALREI